MTPAEDIRDIRGPIVEAASATWWPYALVAVLAIVLVAVAARALLRRRAGALAPHERALRRLDASRALIAGADPHRFSVEVSAAVRAYVEEAFAVHAPRRTTEELLGALMIDGSPVAAHRGALGPFLAQCDLAKYARSSLSPADMTRMVDTAQTFVRATAPGGTP